MPLPSYTEAYLARIDEIFQEMCSDSNVNVSDILFVAAEIAVRHIGAIHAVCSKTDKNAIEFVHELICPGVIKAYAESTENLTAIRAKKNAN